MSPGRLEFARMVEVSACPETVGAGGRKESYGEGLRFRREIGEVASRDKIIKG
jgi:hypothetical protein